MAKPNRSDKETIASLRRIVLAYQLLLEAAEERINQLESHIQFIQPSHPADGC